MKEKHLLNLERQTTRRKIKIATKKNFVFINPYLVPLTVTAFNLGSFFSFIF